MGSVAAGKTAPAVAGRRTAKRPQSGMHGVARQTTLYGIGMVIGKAVSFLMMPVYTRFLTPADYGVMELVSMTLDVVTIVAGGSLVGGVYRFYHKAETETERNAVVMSALVLLSINFTLAALAAFILAPQLSGLLFGSDRHAMVIRVAACTVAVTPLLNVSHAYCRLRDWAGLFVGSNLVKLFIAAVINVVLLLRGWGLLAMFVSGLVAAILVGGGLTIRMLREVGLRTSSSAVRDLLRFGLPLVATTVATFTFTFGDRYFLQNAGDEHAVGLYMFAYQFGFLLVVGAFNPFMQVWGPRRFEIAKRSDRDELLARGFIYSNLMLLPAASAMVLFIPDFFRIMTTPAFYTAAQYVPVILAAYVLQSWGNIQDIGILVRERTGFLTAANWIAGAVALVGYAILIPRYLAWGAAWATLITFAVRYVLIFHFSQRLWPVEYHWTPVLKLVAVAGLVAAIGMAMPTLPLWASLPLRSAVLAVALAAIWNAGILTDEDRRAVADRVRTVLGKVSALGARVAGRTG